MDGWGSPLAGALVPRSPSTRCPPLVVGFTATGAPVTANSPATAGSPQNSSSPRALPWT